MQEARQDMSTSINISLDTAYVTTSGIDAEINDVYKLDRYLGDTLSLPCKYNDVKIPTNELCVSDNINASFKKIYDNFVYLNAQARLASNNFPRNYRGILATTFNSGSASVGWYAQSTTKAQITSELTQTNGPSATVLTDIIDGAFAYAPSTYAKYFGFIVNSSTLFVIDSNSSDTVANINLRKTTIEDSSSIAFTNIKSVDLDTSNNLFILDDVNLYKFNVSAILTDNTAISHIGRFLIRSIGGMSKNINDKDRFGNPVAITIDKNDKVYVLDRGDRGIKVYDKDLNWIRSASRKKDFRDIGGNVVDIATHNETGNVYVLSDNGGILEYSSELFLLATYNFQGKNLSTETYRQMSFSKKDGDLIYILTNLNLYKCFRTKLTKPIGAFRFTENGITEDRYTFVTCLYTGNNADVESVFTGAYSTHSTIPHTIGKVYKFNESINYLTLVNDRYKKNLIPITSVYINSGEYITPWVINKSIYKLLYNHIIFMNNIIFKYTGQYTDQGHIQFSGVRYLTTQDTNLFNLVPDMNYFIGINEPVFAETINRPLKHIHSIQTDLLNICKEEIINTFPLPSQVVELN